MMQLTGWYCLNWHNLGEQSKKLAGGDVFNVGPMESGKTTWVDAVQLVVTAGVNMEWNSAADPTMSRHALKEKGRSLHGIVFREEKGRYRVEDRANRSYFAIELSDGDHHVVLGVCAYGTSHRSKHIEDWWIYAPGKRLQDLTFKRSDANGDYALTEAEFQEANGRATMQRKAQYRVAVAKLLFGDLADVPSDHQGEEARSRMDEMQRFLNLAKSYGRLNSASIDDLFRDALPKPDEDRLQQAKLRFGEIDTLRKAIKRGEDRLGTLETLNKAVERVRDQRIVIAGTEYGEAWNEYEAAATAKNANQAEIATLATDEETQDRELTALEARWGDQTKLANDLRSSEDGQLVRSADEKRREVGRLETAALTAEQRRSALATAAASLRTAHGEAERIVAGTRRDLYAAASQVAATSPAELKPAYAALAEAYRQDPSADIQARLADVRRVVRQAGSDLEQKARALEGKKALVQQAADTAKQELEEHRRHPYPSAMPGLDDAIADVKKDVVVVHRALAIRQGRERDAALLEQYLPPSVLGAVIPQDGTRTDSIRRKIHDGHPELRVVERDELTDGPLEGLLGCLDPNHCNPLALAYLRHNYNDVAILDRNEDRGEHQRVVWRDGRVYDGIAWTLTDPSGPLTLIGAGAIEAHHARELQLAKAYEDQAAAVQTVAADIDALTRQKSALERRLTDSEDTWTRSTLDAKLGALSQAALRKATAEERLTEAVTAKAAADDAWKGAKQALDDIETAIEVKGSKKILARIEAADRAAAETEKAAKDKREQLGGTRRVLSGQRAATPALQARSEAARATLTQRRQQLLAAGADVQGDFDDWTRSKGFHSPPASLKSMLIRATGLEGGAKTDAKTLCAQLAQDDLALSYDEQTNQVRETNTPIVLASLIQRLQLETATERKHQIQKIETIQQEQIVGPIADQMKRNIDLKDRLVRDVNASLAHTTFNGDTFKLKPHERRDSHGGFLRLIREYDGSDSSALVDAIRSRLQGDQDATLLLESFDYRRWFTFELVRVDGQAELSVTEHRAKASGGGQAAPHYILMFILLGVFYDAHTTRLRLAVLDEAFRGVDSGHALHLIELAKRMNLTLLTADTEKAGHPTMQSSAAVQQFARSQTGDAFVMTFTQAFGTKQ